MYLIYGKQYLGKIQTYKEQSIKTQFFTLFFLPIFPIKSMYVTSSEFFTHKGIEIPKNIKSIKAAYARTFFFIVMLISGFIVFQDLEYKEFLATTLPIFLVSIGSYIYFLLFYGKATMVEIEIRNKLNESIGVSILPSWFDSVEIINYYKNYESDYKSKYKSDWKEDVINEKISLKERPTLYAIALFNYIIYQSEENEKLFDKVENVIE